MNALDRIVPAKALRWGRLTRPWPELDVWGRANPAIGDRLLPEALWDAATADMPPGVIEFDGHRYPLIEFSDEWDHLPEPWEDPS